MKWKKSLLLQHGAINEKQLIRAILDINKRLSKLESENAGEVDSNTAETPNEPVETPTERTLSFSVTDGTNPVEGATVVIGNTTKTTGSAGGCTFTGIVDGTYSVEVSKEGFTTKTESITSDETHTSFTITLVAV